MIKLTTNLILFVIVAGLILFSCKKEKTEEKDPPAIPPASSFIMDFSGFSNAKDTSGTKATDSTCRAWGTSFLNVAIWNAIIGITAVVPVASFRESFNHTPEYLGKNKWRWSYDVTTANATYSAELEANLDESNNVNWFMFISKAGQYERFLWYAGFSKADGNSGSWLLYESPNKRTPLINIEWERDPAAGTGRLKYTNAVPNGPENGGYIEYGLRASTNTYNAYYSIYNKGQNNLSLIEWNTTTKIGRISDPKAFKDNGQYHCWNNKLQDCLCP